jgi:hypothetical protein
MSKTIIAPFELNQCEAMQLQTLALRYAARDLNNNETEAFENRLASEQVARDALSEAVRLSAAALGQSPPAPHSSFRAVIRERLLSWSPGWLARRAYRGHPLAWIGVGASALAACLVIGLSLTEAEPKRPLTSTNATIDDSSKGSDLKSDSASSETRPVCSEEWAIAPMPREHSTNMALANCNDEHANKPSVAEIWAELSTPDHVEKAHDEELRWRHKLREMGTIHPGRPASTASVNEPREQ